MNKPNIIHVNVNMMRFNAQTGANEPCIVVCPNDGSEPLSAHEVIIRDRFGDEVARVVNRPNAKLPSGAQAWVETTHHVELVDQQTVLAPCPAVESQELVEA